MSETSPEANSEVGPSEDVTVLPMKVAEVVALLRSNPVFASSPTADLQSLAADATAIEFAPRARVLGEGDRATHLHVLVDGVIRVYHDDGQGRQVTVKHLSPPSTFSEMEILTGHCQLESAESLTRTKLIRIPAAAFGAFLDQEPTATQAMLRDICRRCCVAARNEHAVFFEVETRLASLFLSYADLFGKERPMGLRINIKLTQDDLANGLGVVVRSVSRTLTTWKKKGWISIRKGWYFVHDREALEKIGRGLRFNLNYRFQAQEDTRRHLPREVPDAAARGEWAVHA